MLSYTNTYHRRVRSRCRWSVSGGRACGTLRECHRLVDGASERLVGARDCSALRVSAAVRAAAQIVLQPQSCGHRQVDMLSLLLGRSIAAAPRSRAAGAPATRRRRAVGGACACRARSNGRRRPLVVWWWWWWWWQQLRITSGRLPLIGGSTAVPFHSASLHNHRRIRPRGLRPASYTAASEKVHSCGRCGLPAAAAHRPPLAAWRVC